MDDEHFEGHEGEMDYEEMMEGEYSPGEYPEGMYPEGEMPEGYEEHLMMLQ